MLHLAQCLSDHEGRSLKTTKWCNVQCILGHDQYFSDLVIEKKISSLIKSLIIDTFFKYLLKSKISCMLY